MSVLNQSGEEQVECPLCMEPLEVDDLNFYPCTCGYQICRFCWHRIRTDENGLCPACRKAYSEDPADFIPLSQEQVAALKAEKRHRDQQKKAKLSESRKHLASVRVVQRNLVFVVGLPIRLAEPEVLKRHEYFGKFGRIHKVVINQSTAYAGSQGPSASAYVTYVKSDDALRAIQSVNNVTIDGRLIKSSLGTTKYCSHFMKNQSCPKPDCMYLHDFGDPEASFTKEEMHAGKHQEYEKKLHDGLVARTSSSGHVTPQNPAPEQQQPIKKKDSTITTTTTTNTNKDNWPQLNTDKDGTTSSSSSSISSTTTKERKNDGAHHKCDKDKTKTKKQTKEKRDKEKKTSECSSASSVKTAASETSSTSSSITDIIKFKDEITIENKLSLLDDNSSFFSHNTFHKLAPGHDDAEEESSEATPSLLTDSFPPINTSEDWAAAFGFNKLEEVRPMRPATPPDLAAGLDMHMTKFFMDFMDYEKKGGAAAAAPPAPQPAPPQKENNYYTGANGYNNTPNGYYLSDRLLLLQHQKKVEEHFMNLSLRQNTYAPPTHNVEAGLQQQQQQQNGYGNGYHNHLFSKPPNTRPHAEDELDFDPFQETQKALAELMANEQSYTKQNTVRATPTNGMVHQSKHLPPPPPGFVQPTTHMNSFGSKILPFLNMSQQQQQQQQTPNWAGYNNVAPPQHKGGASSDWKDFDSAIVTTSRPCPLPPIRDQYIHQQQIGNGLRPHLHDYQTNSGYTNFTQQIQPNYNNYSSHLNNSTNGGSTTANINWFASEINTQISSPPGFRNTNQTSKQQEC